MKKKILIILFLCVYFPIKAQNSIRLIDILLDFCQEITQENPSEEKMYYIFLLKEIIFIQILLQQKCGLKYGYFLNYH